MTADLQLTPVKLFALPTHDNVKLNKLSGGAYKFTITFPYFDGVKELLTKDDMARLVYQLTGECGGCTHSNDVTHPLLQGTWIDENGQLCKGKHAKIEVLTNQCDEALHYFSVLKHKIEEKSGESEVLVELSTVHLLDRMQE